MKIKDKFNFLNENITVRFVYYTERGYRITTAHTLFFAFLRDRLQKAIFGRALKLPLDTKTLKQILFEANFLKLGNKHGHHFISQRVVGEIIIIKAVRNWEVLGGFRPIVIKLKFVKPKAEVIKYYAQNSRSN